VDDFCVHTARKTYFIAEYSLRFHVATQFEA